MKKWILIAGFVLALVSMTACELVTIPPDENHQPTSSTPRTDTLVLNADYEGKSFTEDGIGIVTLHRCVDGDTARFIDQGGSTHYSVRFNGIDTPETGTNPDPWAYAASAFTCDKLTNAEIIVLMAEPGMARFDMYGRYLAYVWYDGRLLNLELIEESYADLMGMPPTYGEELANAWFTALADKRRIHGEPDPNYNYGNS